MGKRKNEKEFLDAVQKLQNLLYHFTSSIIVQPRKNDDLTLIMKKINSLELLRKLERQNNTMMDLDTVEILYHNPDRIAEIVEQIKPYQRIYLHGNERNESSNYCTMM